MESVEEELSSAASAEAAAAAGEAGDAQVLRCYQCNDEGAYESEGALVCGG